MNNKELKQCLKCKKPIEENIWIIEHCQSCFNDDSENVLKIMKNNYLKIEKDIQNIFSAINKVKNELNKKDSLLILKNKYEIDILNLESLISKAKIDLETTKIAFLKSQEFANEIRSKMKWNLLKTKDIKDY